MERQGVSAVIIEDKKGLKKNSLLGNEVKQEQEDIDIFCEKLKIGVKNKLSDDFMIIARIESLILGKSINDALKRAESYCAAGVDGIMIHSKVLIMESLSTRQVPGSSQQNSIICEAGKNFLVWIS